MIGKAVDLLFGLGGLASFIRQRRVGEQLAGISLTLDLGVTKTIPASIRNLVRHRDRHCRWPGCRQPAPGNTPAAGGLRVPGRPASAVGGTPQPGSIAAARPPSRSGAPASARTPQ